jgi:hypothetical protein
MKKPTPTEVAAMAARYRQAFNFAARTTLAHRIGDSVLAARMSARSRAAWDEAEALRVQSPQPK